MDFGIRLIMNVVYLDKEANLEIHSIMRAKSTKWYQIVNADIESTMSV